VEEFRKQLDIYAEQTGKHYLLTSFLPAAPAKIDAGFEVDKLFADLDFATVQGYDLHGTWEPLTNHQSNLLTERLEGVGCSRCSKKSWICLSSMRARPSPVRSGSSRPLGREPL
jgi:GH18 family chitinase